MTSLSDSRRSYSIKPCLRALFLFGLAPLAGCPPALDCSTELWLSEEGVPETAQVSVVGDFNGWNPTVDPMERVDGGWRAVLHLPAGDYRYTIRVDGVDRADPFAALITIDDAGAVQSRLRVEDCAVGVLELASAAVTPEGALTVEARFLRGDERLDRDSVRATIDGDPVPVDVHLSAGRLGIAATGLPPGKHTVVLTAADRDGTAARPLRVPLWVEDEPFSWEGAVIYQVVLDRFAGPDGAVAGTDPGARFGGTLAGFTRILEDGYLDDLGVTALWLSPLYRNPEGRWPAAEGHDLTGYHGYWSISPDEVEPALGTEADVHTLVAAAHARGLRVLLDVVPNHVHEDHPYRRDHAGDGWFHENPDCLCGDYDCPWADEIQTCWFAEYLPDLALENPVVAERVVADTAAWATRFDVDGFRIDAVPMLRRDVVRELVWGLRRELEQGPVPFFLLGETFTGPGAYDDIAANLGPFGLDGQFEFPILWEARRFLAHGSGDAAALEEVVTASELRWSGSGSVMSPFVGNHDMTRFLTDAAGDDPDHPWDTPPPQPTDELPYRKLLMAQAFVLSLPGATVLYYGDEVGLAGGRDPDNRRAMPFSRSLVQDWVRERVARVGRARRCSAALRSGRREPVLADGPIYALRRVTGDDQAVLVLNASADTRTVALDLPGRWFDVVEAEGGLDPATLVVGPWTAHLLLPDVSPCTERTSP